MRKIAIANQKGGVAKTTTAVNLGYGLALANRKTLIVDLDPQANATFAILGLKEIEFSTYDLLIRNKKIRDVIQKTNQTPNLDIVPSHIDLAGAEVELIGKVGGQTKLKTKLLELDPNAYDYIIVDAPPSLGFLTINTLASVDEVFIPVSTSIFALNGIAMLEETIRQVRQELNCPNLKIGGVICTMFDNTNVAKDVVAEVKSHFQDLVFKTVIPKNIKLEEAHSRAESVLAYASKSAGALAYQKLVEEVISHEHQ
jgi:chromosome partitioning protein